MKVSYLISTLLFLTISFSCKQATKGINDSKKETSKVSTEGKNKSTYGIADNPNNILGGLKIGDTAPDFQLTNQDGNLMSLSNQLVYSDVLVVFYRGHWCPICNRHLAEFEKELASLKEHDISILAISPDDQDAAQGVTQKNKLSFPILSDPDFEVTAKYKGLFHLKKNEDSKLPIPATYLIGQDHKIKYVHYDPNYKKRSSIDDIIKAKLSM